MATPALIDAAMCERFVSAASRHCPSPPVQTSTVAQAPPEWDLVANSFASLSAAFAWGSILLALIAIAAGVGWGFYVKHWAEKEAREEASKCVSTLMDEWLAEEAPQIIRQSVELLQNASLGSTPDDHAADEMGKEAG